MRNELVAAVVLSALAALGTRATAAPLDDARAALARHDYAAVDKALAPELSSKNPTPDALRVSLDAAEQSGRIVTAASRATALLKITGETDQDLLLRAARIADLNGDTHSALIRYLAAARHATAKSDVVEDAFKYILRNEAYPEEFKEYVALFGPDARAWTLGQAQLARLIEATDGDRALDLAAFLMKTFPAHENVASVWSAIYSAANGYVFGKDPKDRWLKPAIVLARAEPRDYSLLDNMLQQAAPALNEETRSKLLLDVLSRSRVPMTAGMLNQLGADLRALKSEDAKLAGGKAFLAHEDVYLNSPDKEAYYWYVRQIGESPGVFAVKDHALVTADAYVQKFETLKARIPDQPQRLRENISWLSTGYFGADSAGRAAFLQKNLPLLDRDRLGDLASLTKDLNWSQMLATWSLGKTYAEALDARTQQIRFFEQTKDKAGKLATIHDYVTSNPGAFNADLVREHFVGSQLFDAGEKLALIQEFVTKAGYSKPMEKLLNDMAQDQANWAKNPQFQQLKASFDKKPVGTDPAMKTAVALDAIPVNQAQPDPAVSQTVQAFLAQYAGPVPAEEKVTSAQEQLVRTIYSAHANHVWNSAAGVAAWAQAWMPRLQVVGTDWRTMAQRVREHQQWAVLAKMIPAYADLARADKPHNDPEVWANFGSIPMAAAQVASPFTTDYDLIGTEQAFNWLFNQRDVWSARRQYIADEWAKVVAAPGAKITDAGLIGGVVNNAVSWGNAPQFNLSPAVVAALWDGYVESGKKTGAWNVDLEAQFYALYQHGGKDREADAAAQFARWQDLLKTRPPEQQAAAYGHLFRWAQPPSPVAGSAGKDFRHEVVFDLAKPQYQKIDLRSADQTFISANLIGDVVAAANAAPPTDPKNDPKVDAKTYPQVLAAYNANHADAVAYCKTLLTLFREGARSDGGANYIWNVADVAARDALARDDLPTANAYLSAYASYLGGDLDWNGLWTQTLAPVMKILDEKKADETTYAFLNSIQKRAKLPEPIAKAMMLVKARAATQIPDIIPVGPEDPSYDLFLAAHDLAVGDEQHAWELTSPRLKLLVQTWPGFDPSYVAWSVEQLRKQKMLKDGLDFAFNILLHEKDLDPDVAARILLARGDIYRDMENYQAARIEYEGLKNNALYNKTDAGGRAGYRLADLYILTKDYPAAEQVLERLVDSDSVQKQADAWYLYAKMAFQKGDYKDARDDLKKVKDRVLNHVEAALLEGELNLVLPGGLQNTEVAIGDPRLSTVVIPGRPLTLTLQDPNLSIARGGAAIPVVVTAQKSGDVEHVKLLPSSSNKNLFTANIATALGVAQKDNLTLELRGDDRVSYEIEPEFQKANDLHYAPKELSVRFDAKLAASSGEILSDEEQERRELERQLQIRTAGVSRATETSRDGRTVRPGSRIYVQVTDFCEDLTDQPDRIKVDLKTGLGDVLEGVELTETGSHTGVFRGAVPTGLPLPRALASDTDAGKSPAGVIAGGDAWTSLADARRGKWIEVDTMSSNDVSVLTAEIPHLDQIKDLTVSGMLADDYEELASLPARAEARGGLLLDIAPDQNGDSAEQIRRHLKLATASTVPQESAAFTRDSTPMKGKEGWQTTRLKGVFYLPENRALELKWLSPPPPQDWLRCHVLIDGQEVIDGHNSTTLNRTGRVELTKGPHTYELLVRDNFAQSQVVVGYKTDAGTFEPIPADWFSIKAHPQLAEHLRPKGKITVAGDTLTLKLDQPHRLRKLRLTFNDFLGNSVSVRSIALNDSAGKAIVPAPRDLNGPAKSVLPVSPGDTITVSYNDRRRLHEDAQTITSTLNSSYFNGNIVLAEEVITGTGDQRRTEYLEAKRCRPGDQLSVIVTDFDLDTTEDRDTVPVTVTTSSGEKLTITALESQIADDPAPPNHSGRFLAILKIGNQTGKDTIKVRPGDKITVSYVDRENTDPGIPVERTYSVNEAGQGEPQFLVYRTRVRMVEDDSPEAKARLERLAGKAAKGAVLYKPQVIARHPDYQASGAPTTRPAGRGIVTAVNAPLLFEVHYPERVLNAGSVLEVTAVADSELKAAAAQKRPPKFVKVPAYVMGIERLAQIKGYPIQVESPEHRDERAMLRDGDFAGVVRLQIGSPGDQIDDMVVGGEREFAREQTGPTEQQSFWYKVPTLLVAGADTVHLQIKDDRGQTGEQTIRLLSDGRIELLDPSYTLESDEIHLGEKFHVRVTDPDHDTTDDRDTVKVRVRSTSGGDVALTLNETLPHSGVFTGTVEPQFVGESAPGQPKPTTRPGGDTLYANFGDEVVFDYLDDLTIESTSPVLVTKRARVLYGADAQIAVFTKKFKDPEIAVKTRFLMAEALFETAKEHRKLNQVQRADEEIARGKQILEEAIRDYPNTSLAAQGDYLLANLAQELTKYQEAIGRYSNVIGTFPDSEYASQSQFKKALCFEKLQNYDQACEEYVKLTYIYPESPLVADATVRLGNYYYKKQSYKIASKIFFNFQQKNPSHKLAAEALFLSAQCNYKLADWRESVRMFQKVVDEYPDDKVVRPEAMYWLADADVKASDNVKAYQSFKRLTWDYPDSEWAKRARGRLTEDAFSRMGEEQQ